MREPRMIWSDGRKLPYSQATSRDLRIAASGVLKPRANEMGQVCDEFSPGFAEQYAAILLRERGL